MSYTEGLTSAFGVGPQNALADAQAQQQSFQNLQQQRVLGALASVNLDDPNSTNNTMQSLTRVGALEQAAALSNLGRARAVNAYTTDVAQTSQSQYDQQQQGGQQSGQTGQLPGYDPAKHMRLLGEANAALGDLQTITDPVARQARADQYAAYFKTEEQGVPDAAVDGVLGDVSDPAQLKMHQAAIQDHMLTDDPNYQKATALVSSALQNPQAVGLMAANGMDPSASLNAAANIISNTRQARTQLAIAQPTAQSAAFGSAAGGVQGQAANLPGVKGVAEANASGAATGQAEVGAPPVAGAELLTDANGKPAGWRLPGGTLTAYEQSAQATAQGTQNVTKAPEGGRVILGPSGDPIGVEPIPGYTSTQANQVAQRNVADASSQTFTADLNTARGAISTLASLKDIDRLAPTTNTGPATDVTNKWKQFLTSNLPIITKMFPDFDTSQQIEAADYNELAKDMLRVSSGTANATFGSGSDFRLAQSLQSNANPSMNNLSTQTINRMTTGLYRAQNALPLIYAANGGAPEGYSAWAAHEATTIDPRAFVLDMLSPQQRRDLVKSIPKADLPAFSQGVIDAGKAGYYQYQNLPK